MSLTSKSPRTVAIVALEVGRRTLPDDAHRFAPKPFTQPQRFACLVLKAFFRTDYRGIERYLHDLPELCRVLGLKRIPDHSTLHKASRRLFEKGLADRMLDTTVVMTMKQHDRGSPWMCPSAFWAASAMSRKVLGMKAKLFTEMPPCCPQYV